jgi:hypothetical protein
MSDILAGEYEIRYKSLAHRRYAKSRAMELIEAEENGGTRFSVVTITLYTVKNGNARFTDLDEKDF